MRRQILIAELLSEIRVAVLEDGRLTELWIDVPDRERLVGAIYLGRVKRIVRGINAAFVDIGLPQDAFLHFSDVAESVAELTAAIQEEGQEESASSTPAARQRIRSGRENGSPPSYPVFQTRRAGKVVIPLEAGQKVLVQVMRDAYAEKGVRVTTHVTIPGHYVVLSPLGSGVGVSQKITDEEERRRLRRVVRSVLPEDYGCIVRTAAQGQSPEVLQQELKWLLAEWQRIERQARTRRAPQLLRPEDPIYIEAMREFLSPEVERILVDSRPIYNALRQYLKRVAPGFLPRLELYTDKESLFDRFEIESEVARLYQRRVPLPSGGSLVIDHTEAMTVIDVNAGRSLSDPSQEINALRTNLEAAREIARQVRLRDIGGIVLVDFIDLQQERHRQQVYEELKRELARDRAKTVVYPMTHLGMLPFTRQRVGRNILEKLTEPCPTCQGSGRLYGSVVVLNSLERWLRNFRTHTREWRVLVRVHPTVARQLTQGIFSRRLRLMLRYRVWLRVQPEPRLPMDQFRCFSLRRQRDVTDEYRS
ncbi:MAG: Rne/Rng family ribonuclease [Candidatus Kapabacteria bacterium]|nr:Rne/Rng family ribonuclease [Candidatus Kapabacteria bacterium]MDW8012964.1 Rne/Rng family ribonuclease [Bacteroidota bacterium]